MIPQNIKSAIDKYKSRIPTDEELTALFDLVNSAKLKGRQQEEVWEYFETVQKEAEASIKAKEQEILDKQQKQAQEDRARRIQQAKLAARKKKEKEERMYTLFGIGLSVLLSCGFILFVKDMSMAGILICLGIVGTPVTLGLAFGAFEERDQKKVAYRLFWVTLFYVILGVIGFFMAAVPNDKSVTETEKVCNVNINRDSIDIEGLRNVLINTFGQDYSFYIETPEVGRMRLGDKDVYVKIKVTENSTQEKGNLYVVPSSEGKTEVVKTADVASMSCGYKISDAISEWVEKNIR